MAGENIVEIKCVDDFIKLSFHQPFYFICKNCGNEYIINQFRKNRIPRYSTFLCDKCNFKKNYPGKKAAKKRRAYFRKTYGVDNSSQVPEFAKKSAETRKNRTPEQKEQTRIKTAKTTDRIYGPGARKKGGIIHNKFVKTMNDEYGVDYSGQSPELFQKSCNTKEKKYGDPFYTNYEQGIKTYAEKHGIEYDPEIHKSMCSFEEVQNNVKNTNMQNLGVEYPFQLEEFQQKGRDTKEREYGDPYYTNIEQAKKTCLERTGYENPFYDPKVQEDIVNKIQDKYGVKSYLLTEEFANKMIETYGSEHPFGFGKEATNNIMLEKYGPDWRHMFGYGSEYFNNMMIERYGPDWIKQFGLGSDHFNNKMLEKYGPDWKHMFGFESEHFNTVMSERYGPNWRSTFGSENGFGSDCYSNKLIDKYYVDTESASIINYVLSALDKYGIKHDPGFWTIDDLKKLPNDEKIVILKMVRPDLFTSAKYWLDGFTFDSKWELEFYVFYRDNGSNIRRNNEPLNYEYRGNRKCFPDFIVDGKLVEVKGNHFYNENGKMYLPFKRKHGKLLTPEEKEFYDGLYAAKQQCMLDNGVEFKVKEDIVECDKYVKMNYGNNFFSDCLLSAGICRMMFCGWFGVGVTPFDTGEKICSEEGVEYVFDDNIKITPFDKI